MRDVAIIGIGQTEVGEHWGSGLRELGAAALQSALQDARVQMPDLLIVGNAFGGSNSSQSNVAALVADYAGLNPVEAWGVDAADASGGAALRAAYLAVASGSVNVAVALGVEKSSDSIAGRRIAARNVALDADYESVHGMTLSAQAGLLMRRYMMEHGLALDAFEGFSINAHANGNKNPNAMYRNLIKPGSFSRAPMVADPVNLFDSAPDADGAAAVVLIAADRARSENRRAVLIAGSAAASDRFALQERRDPLWLDAADVSARNALAQAETALSDIQCFELHDSFTIMTTLALEAIGLAPRGQGWSIAAEAGAHIGLTGKTPLATFGGLKARGNPVGATGLYQAVEAVLQLRGEAGANQVANARSALIQSIGGIGSTAITHVLQAMF
jgi:acetyl-CoA C-acetyltransferase